MRFRAAALVLSAGMGLTVAPAFGQSRSDFSGTWVRHGRSSITWTIRADDNSFRVERPRQTITFAIGGSTTINPARGPQRTSQARWSGDTLIIESTDGRGRSATETWELLGSNTLRVTLQHGSPGKMKRKNAQRVLRFSRQS